MNGKTVKKWKNSEKKKKNTQMGDAENLTICSQVFRFDSHVLKVAISVKIVFF